MEISFTTSTSYFNCWKRKSRCLASLFNMLFYYGKAAE